MGYIFEWDPKKAESNARKHGVTFDEAVTAFRDPLSLLLSTRIIRLARSGMLCSGCRTNDSSWWWLLPSGHHAPA